MSAGKQLLKFCKSVMLHLNVIDTEHENSAFLRKVM